MPAVLERKEKQYRMDIRARAVAAPKLRARRVASRTDPHAMATSHLDESARRDIDEATTTILAPQAFDEFCAMLDAPMPQAAADLLSRKAVWE